MRKVTRRRSRALQKWGTLGWSKKSNEQPQQQKEQEQTQRTNGSDESHLVTGHRWRTVTKANVHMKLNVMEHFMTMAVIDRPKKS